MSISTTPVNQSTGNGTSALSVTIPAANSGNVLIAVVAIVALHSIAYVVSGLTCTNVVWTYVTRTAGLLDLEIWYGIVSGGNSGTTVSFSLSGATSHTAANITEWSGVLISSPVDNSNKTSGSGTTPTVPTMSTNFGNDLVIVVESHANSTAPSATPNGFTPMTSAASGTSL